VTDACSRVEFAMRCVRDRDLRNDDSCQLQQATDIVVRRTLQSLLQLGPQVLRRVLMLEHHQLGQIDAKSGRQLVEHAQGRILLETPLTLNPSDR
jgi:hypothetical protein